MKHWRLLLSATGLLLLLLGCTSAIMVEPPGVPVIDPVINWTVVTNTDSGYEVLANVTLNSVSQEIPHGVFRFEWSLESIDPIVGGGYFTSDRWFTMLKTWAIADPSGTVEHSDIWCAILWDETLSPGSETAYWEDGSTPGEHLVAIIRTDVAVTKP